MSLDEDMVTYGPKVARLKYVNETDPTVPIEPYVLVPIGADWRDYRGEINKLGDCLVRSTSNVEGRGRVGFSGLFKSVNFDGSEKSVQQVLDSAQSEEVQRYAQIHGVTEPIKLGVFFHKKSESTQNWSMVRHPHRPEIIFVMGRPVNVRSDVSHNYVFDENTGGLTRTDDWGAQVTHPDGLQHYHLDSPPVEQINEAITNYKKTEAMPGFQDGFTRLMEFGLHPFSAYQWTPFREKEVADWTLRGWALDDFVIYPLSFGITPSDGVPLNLVRGIFGGLDVQFAVGAMRKEFSHLPLDEATEKLAERMGLNQVELPYARYLAKHDTTFIRGAHVAEVFGEISNSLSDRRNSLFHICFSYGYYGEDLDLLFPDSRALVLHGGLEFLSHNRFRAMQHYDYAMSGDQEVVTLKTGDRLRLFSDGRKAIITED